MTRPVPKAGSSWAQTPTTELLAPEGQSEERPQLFRDVVIRLMPWHHAHWPGSA